MAVGRGIVARSARRLGCRNAGGADDRRSRTRASRARNRNQMGSGRAPLAQVARQLGRPPAVRPVARRHPPSDLTGAAALPKRTDPGASDGVGSRTAVVKCLRASGTACDRPLREVASTRGGRRRDPTAKTRSSFLGFSAAVDRRGKLRSLSATPI
jgi:hypothetical protein